MNGLVRVRVNVRFENVLLKFKLTTACSPRGYVLWEISQIVITRKGCSWIDYNSSRSPSAIPRACEVFDADK